MPSVLHRYGTWRSTMPPFKSCVHDNLWDYRYAFWRVPAGSSNIRFEMPYLFLDPQSAIPIYQAYFDIFNKYIGTLASNIFWAKLNEEWDSIQPSEFPVLLSYPAHSIANWRNNVDTLYRYGTLAEFIGSDDGLEGAIAFPMSKVSFGSTCPYHKATLQVLAPYDAGSNTIKVLAGQPLAQVEVVTSYQIVLGYQWGVISPATFTAYDPAEFPSGFVFDSSEVNGDGTVPLKDTEDTMHSFVVDGVNIKWSGRNFGASLVKPDSHFTESDSLGLWTDDRTVTETTDLASLVHISSPAQLLTISHTSKDLLIGAVSADGVCVYGQWDEGGGGSTGRIEVSCSRPRCYHRRFGVPVSHSFKQEWIHGHSVKQERK